MLMVHEALEASVPADRPAELAPATAEAVPPQVLVRLLGVATTKPEGRVSVKAMPVSAEEEFGLVTVKVREVGPFSGMVETPKALAIAGGKSVPVPLRAKVWGLLLPLSVMLRVATSEPTTEGVRVTEILQVAPTATVAPQVVVLEKSPEFVPVMEIAEMVNVPPVLLVRVTVREELGTPTA